MVAFDNHFSPVIHYGKQIMRSGESIEPDIALPRERRGLIVKALILFFGILSISLLHYFTPTTHHFLHNVYQRLYYIPIILACYWFGLAGGILSSFLAALLYAPHILFQWSHEKAYTLNQTIEIIMFFVIAAIAGTLSDVQKRIQEKYRRAAEERDATLAKLHETFERLRLADKLSTLGKLSAEIAHEIKNPLSGVYGSIEILEKEFPADHPKYEFVQILKKEMNQLSSVVHRYLDLARPHKPEKRKHQINELIETLLSITSAQAGKKGITLKKDLASDLPDLFIDAEQLKQALLNILINSIQATPGGRSVEIASFEEGSRVCVSFKDEGIGVAKEYLGKIFDPLFTTKEEGTGLGLAIAYQIIMQHQGEIHVKNLPQGGALFTVSLPREEAGGQRER